MRRTAVVLIGFVLACNGPHEPAVTVTVPSAPSASASVQGATSPTPTPDAAATLLDASTVRAIRAGKARGPIANAAQALKAFQGAWDEEILPNAIAASRTGDVHAARGASARLGPCREGYERVKDTLGRKEIELWIFSALPALDRPDQCWEVNVPTGHFNEIIGYLDPKTGALIFAWLVPEG